MHLFDLLTSAGTRRKSEYWGIISSTKHRECMIGNQHETAFRTQFTFNCDAKQNIQNIYNHPGNY